MENAAKALLMAGGILLAILTMSVTVYLTSSASRIANAQDEKKEAQQLAEFNRSYEVYNKSLMYGTDLITVVNKAIDHNINIEAQTTEPYYINIIIKTIEDFKTTGIVIDTSLPSDDENYQKDMTGDKIKEKTGELPITILASSSLNEEYSDGYSLGYWDSDEELTMDTRIVKFFAGSKEDKVIKEGREIYYIYSALTNFKRAIFKCESIGYNEITGRINEMTFKQVEIKDID